MGGIDLDWGTALGSLPYMLTGLIWTIIIAVCGIAIGYCIGLMLGVARTSRSKLLYGLATVYVEAIRGTPILVQAVWLYFGMNQLLVQLFQWRIDPIPAGIIVIAINSGAYIAEVVRGSIQSVEKGQVEAGRSLGMTGYETFRHIVFPQALKRMLPPLGNQFIISLKDTSLLSVIAVGEAMRKSQEVVANNFNALEMYTLLALLYLVLTLSLSFGLRQLERRMDGHDHRRSRSAQNVRRARSAQRDQLPG